MTDHGARSAHPELGDVRAAKSSDQGDATAIHHKMEEGHLQAGSSRSRRLRPTSCHYHSCTDAPMTPSAHTDGLPSVWLLEGGKIHPHGPQTGQLGLLVQAGNWHLPDSSPTQWWPWKTEMGRKALKSQSLGQAPSDSPYEEREMAHRSRYP